MSKILKHIFSALLIMLLACSAVKAATCRLNSAESILNIADDITLNPADKGAAGTVLWSKTFPMPDVKYICDTDNATIWHSTYSRNYISTAQDDVYATEIPGIGVRIKWPANGAGMWIPGNSTSLVCKTGCSITGNTVLIEFVQTGTLNQGESYIPAGEIAKANVSPTANTNDKLQIMAINFGSSIKVVTRSCSIYPSSNSIDLGSYDLAYFSNSPSSQGEKKTFNITISCPTPADIALTFTSTANVPFGTGKGIIGVEEGDGYATNFAIRLYEKLSGYSTLLILDKDYEYTVSSSLTKTYGAQIYVPGGINRKTALGAGNIVGAIQYTMAIK